MSKKYYQVFISSTYKDLKKERQYAMEALRKIECIPAGMEYFPAIDENQFNYIKNIIDDCDYYLLILKKNYGTEAPDGISYTEKEFDYALHLGLRPVVLIHKDLDKMKPADANSETERKLLTFREKAKQNRLVSFWKTKSELTEAVMSSTLQTIQRHPQKGFVRGGLIDTEALLLEINDLRKENKQLLDIAISQQKQLEPNLDLADFKSDFTLHGKFIPKYESLRVWVKNISWEKIFSIISPYLLSHPAESYIKDRINNLFAEHFKLEGALYIDSQVFQTIAIQLEAYRLIERKHLPIKDGGMALFWVLTELGRKTMIEDRSVKKTSPENIKALTGIATSPITHDFYESLK